MGFSIEMGIPILTVFLQGLFSFLSPCVLPLVPVYLSYLAGGTGSQENGYSQKKIFVNTFFFVVGISCVFFLLGFGVTAAGRFFSGHRVLIARIGGLVIILFGLYQLGILGDSTTLERERRLPLRPERMAMNPLTALAMGFAFSFAWTPCVGPALTSVLLMATSASTNVLGFVLIGLYTLGFVLPFLAVGLFAGKVLTLFRTHRNVVRWTVKLGGVLMVLIGAVMFSGVMNGFTGYLSGSSDGLAATAVVRQGEIAPDFTVTDQYGETHHLSDYRGKTVFLNFWASWCGPCKRELPSIQRLYEEHGRNAEDLVVLGIAAPNGIDVSQEKIEAFLAQKNYTYPVGMDLTGQIFANYGIRVYPTTFMIDAEGRVKGYVSGGLTKGMMERIVEQTQKLTAKKANDNAP